MIEKITSKDDRFLNLCDRAGILYPLTVKSFEIEGDKIKKVIYWGEAPEGFNNEGI